MKRFDNYLLTNFSTGTFLGSDILLFKLNNESFRNFLPEFTGRNIPCESTIRKQFVQDSHNGNLKEIRDDINRGPI